MKTNKDPRHQMRVKVMQELFAWDFDKEGNVEDYQDIKDKTAHIIADITVIDTEITESAPERGLNEINKIDLSVLRQAIYELMISRDVPVKVVVDEAVEIAKEYGTDSSGSFVNGVLGKVIEKHKLA